MVKAGLDKIMSDVKSNSGLLDNISDEDFNRLTDKVNNLVSQYGVDDMETH